MPTSEQHAGSGIKGLDQVLGGGWPRGQFYVIRGASGAGKTTLSLQFLMDGAQHGEKTLYLGTSETESDIRAVARSHGWSLEGIELHHHGTQLVGAEQTMLYPAEIELPKTMEALLAVVEAQSPQRLVIDSLAEIRVLAQDELWYRRQLVALKRYFLNRPCTVLLVEIPHTGPSALDSVVTGVLELEQITPLYGPDRRRLRVAKIRGQAFESGYHDYRIRAGGIDVFPRLTAADYRRSFPLEQISTGLPAVDTMLQGGLTRGTSTLLLGPSGTGKSLIATQMAVGAAERGECVAFYAFDERVQTLFQRAESVGLPLQRLAEQGTVQVRQIDPAELSSGEFSYVVKSLVEQDRLRLLILDSLNGYAYAMPEERLLSVYLHELASYLSQQAVNSVFTMTQHGLLAERIEQPFDISYIADTVLLFRHFEFAGQVYKAFSVYKSRTGFHETSIRKFLISAQGIQVSKPLRQFQGILSGKPRLLEEAPVGQCRSTESIDD